VMGLGRRRRDRLDDAVDARGCFAEDVALFAMAMRGHLQVVPVGYRAPEQMRDALVKSRFRPLVVSVDQNGERWTTYARGDE